MAVHVKEIYLVRHAQSQPSAAVDDQDWPLSDVGARQAERLVNVLALYRIEAVYSSPYRRCVSTIQPFATARGLAVSLDPSLRERRLAPGLIDNFREVWNLSWEDFDYALPTCETSRDAQDRMVSGLTGTCSSAHWSRAAVCSHGNVIGLFLHSLDDSFGNVPTAALRNPDVLRVVWADGRFALDAAFEANGLDEFATPHRSTPFPRSSPR